MKSSNETRDITARDFLLMQLNQEEKDLRREIRRIKSYISNLHSLKAMARQTSQAALEDVMKKDSEVYAQYLETVRLSKLSYEDWEIEMAKREGIENG